MPPSLFRPAIARVAPYVPGRPIDDVRRETGVDRIIKLGSNEGPLPPFPGAIEAIARVAADQRLYPDPGAWELRDALAARLGVRADNVLVGNGVDSLIKLLCLATLDPGTNLAMGWPSFISWRQGAGIQGAEVRAVPLRGDGSYDLRALAAAVDEDTRLGVVVSPNNPTGAAVTAAELEAFLDALPDHVLPVVDEAYFEFLPAGGHDAAALFAAGRRLVVTRTFSKAYALAGLRVGYMVAPDDVIEALGRVRNAFDVNAVAQAAALASVAEADTELPQRVALVTGERDRVAAALTAAGWNPWPSAANFLFVDVRDADRAARINEGLLARGIIIRPTGPFGAPEGLRITIGLPDENDAMIEALAAVQAERPA